MARDLIICLHSWAAETCSLTYALLYLSLSTTHSQPFPLCLSLTVPFCLIAQPSTNPPPHNPQGEVVCQLISRIRRWKSWGAESNSFGKRPWIETNIQIGQLTLANFPLHCHTHTETHTHSSCFCLDCTVSFAHRNKMCTVGTVGAE